MSLNVCGNPKKIKICGLKRIEDIIAANNYKPDFIGFIFFTKSKRYVSFEDAAALKKTLDENIKAVGVFVNEDINTCVKLYTEKVIDYIQLHGSETKEDIKKIKVSCDAPVIKAVSVKSVNDILFWDDSLADFLLLDNGSGGSGERFDWSALSDYIKFHEEKDDAKPVFLAGGINLSNIKEALKYPSYALDLSGGAETDGLKDSKKMEELIKIAHFSN